jgi:hypothetical protein
MKKRLAVEDVVIPQHKKYRRAGEIDEPDSDICR